MSDLRIDALRGGAARPHVQALAQLRITVFREWPYLYDGSLEYERKYLQTYLDCPDSLIVMVRDGNQCVGASTVLPLSHAESAMQAPFLGRGVDIDPIAYFGESLLLRSWRGRGLGVKFFEMRETHARSMGLKHCAFCAVVRPDTHPARPGDYVPNDAFWQRRGYSQLPGMRCHFDWLDVGGAESTSKTMQFWMKSL